MSLALAISLLLACGQPAPPPPGPGGPPPQAQVNEVEPPQLELLPGVNHLPANALVFELHWSKAMRLGPYGVSVFDPGGAEVVGAVHKVSWDAPVRVTTVELSQLEHRGPLTMRIDGFLSTDGGVAPAIDHTFTVLPVDERGPDGARVEVRGKPLAGTSEPVTVRFPEPMSHRIIDSVTLLSGPEPAPGEWTLGEAQSLLTFTPSQPWTEAPVRVSIGAGAVDLAGNAIVDLPPGLLTPMVELEEPLPIPVAGPEE